MKTNFLYGIKTVFVLSACFALTACVEIKSEAKIDSEAKVGFSTTYDLTKALPVLQQMSKDADVSKNLSCDKMNEKLTKSLTCKDIAPGKFVVSGEFVGDAGNGVVADKDKNQLTVDAVQLFKTVADLNPAKNTAGATDPASVLMEKGLVPVANDQAAMYKQMGMSLVLNVSLPGDVQQVDGAAAKEIKDNVVSVNFIDVAGKDNYLITSKLTKNRFAWKLLFILLMLSLIAFGIWYLMKRQKSSASSKSDAVVEPVVTKEPVKPVSPIELDDVVKNESLEADDGAKPQS